MLEFDKVTMKRPNKNAPFVCLNNEIYYTEAETLDQGDPVLFSERGYVFVEVGTNQVEIYVGRLDVEALTRATREFHKQY